MLLKDAVVCNMYSKSEGIIVLTIYPDEEVDGAQDALCKALWCKYRKPYDFYKQSDGINDEVQPESIDHKYNHAIENFDLKDAIEVENDITPYVYVYHFSPDVMETILALGFDEWLDNNLGRSM